MEKRITRKEFGNYVSANMASQTKIHPSYDDGTMIANENWEVFLVEIETPGILTIWVVPPSSFEKPDQPIPCQGPCGSYSYCETC